MDKKNILKIVFAVAAVSFLIFELFALGILGGYGNYTRNASSNTQNETDSNITGITEFYGTLIQYEPYLIISKILEGEELNAIKSHQSVESVAKSQNGIVVSLKKREDIAQLYNFLQKENTTAIATTIATVSVPSRIEVKTPADIRNVSVARGVNLRLSIEPFPAIGEQIKIRMPVLIQSDTLQGYGTPVVSPDEKQFYVNASIVKLKGMLYRYFIPWEERNQLSINTITNYSERFGKDNVTYAKRNEIYFEKVINSSILIEKKKLRYIIFINEYSATVNDSITNRTVILNDFSGFNVTFPASVLDIYTLEILDYYKNFQRFDERRFDYIIQLPETIQSYKIKDRFSTLLLNESKKENSSVSLRLTVLSVGSHVTSIKNITNLK